MEINSKNILGWLRLAADVLPLELWMEKKLRNYLARTDTTRRQKELDDIFGGETWLI